ncbi:hypothetical protein JTB14_009262 [Gonioctena quinquepunctata]|nr:hypothetical protein JTB14_009262 [Gonioctena quinquepunctata]
MAGFEKKHQEKIFKRRQHSVGTSGGPPLPNVKLSSSEEKLMNILGETAEQGHPDMSESIWKYMTSWVEPENIPMTGSKKEQPTLSGIILIQEVEDVGSAKKTIECDHNYARKKTRTKSKETPIYDNSLEASIKMAEAVERDQQMK